MLASSEQVPEQLLPCFMVNNLTTSEEQCKFVLDNNCLEDESIIDYVYLVFCDMSAEMRVAAIILVVSLVVVLFLNLSAVADECLCPNLLMVAKNLRMSDSLAGITLLAFGNGCPDIFSSIAAASGGRPEIIVGELLGAGIFCTSIVAGLIFIHADFKVARRPLLRDASFYLLAVYLIWLYCYQGSITFYNSLVFIIIYVIYLFVALCGQAIHSRLRGEYPVDRREGQDGEDRENSTPIVVSHQKGLDSYDNWITWREGSHRRGSLVKRLECSRSNEAKSKLVISDQQKGSSGMNSRIELGDSGKKANCDRNDQTSGISSSQAGKSCKSCTGSTGAELPHQLALKMASANALDQGTDHLLSGLDELREFLELINPINRESWREANLIGRSIFILRAPILFITILTVPVVNSERKNNNWNRVLNSIQCSIIPIATIVFLRLGTTSEDETSSNSRPMNDHDHNDLRARHADYQPSVMLAMTAHLGNLVSIKSLLIAPGVLLAIFVFYATKANKAPRYHVIYSYFGFMMSVMWIYKLATEIISILKTVGILFSMTDTAIGLGVLAWGNSLGDIVANLTLAEAGYARMALGASIGAPLLNLLIGFGLAFCLSLEPGGSVKVQYTHTTTLLATTLAFVLSLLMLSTLAPGNKSKRPFGYLLISCYGVYFALAVCLESGLIKF